METTWSKLILFYQTIMKFIYSFYSKILRKQSILG